MSLRDEREERDSARAWALGVEYGKAHRLADVEARCTPGTSDAMDREAMQMGCPYSFFDVFKYGAQSIWRECKELPTRRSLHTQRNVSASYRRSLPSSAFVFPEEDGWPYQSRRQAKRALTWAEWPQHRRRARVVRRAVFERYPELREEFAGGRYARGGRRNPPLASEETDLLLVRGQDAGNYDAAYVGGFAEDWDNVMLRDHAEDATSDAFRAGYVIGFISGVSDEPWKYEDYADAVSRWGERLEALGRVVDRGDEVHESPQRERLSESGATKDEIVEAAARAFFVSAWAKYEERKGRNYAGQELMDVAPRTPSEALKTAKAFVTALEEDNNRNVAELYEAAIRLPGRHLEEPSPHNFGHYLAMEALGHGVGWSDDHPPHGYQIPRVEFYMESKKNFWWEVA